ncbi:barstar family protein [Chryseobacterium limigenitum]|uniref:Ribonuclease inhibitor n=1 Tax=Chryseobacterium limigenitum TaxID=1612149 RepID=A0A1K2ILE4_9FLAO|nr:barstar family protein [Chryseobacterium limigenitum]SFZ92491.1 ribonuclease inhibitor [Chryseobacterium limigenitum]
MKTIYIDFTDIGDYEDFYTQLKEKITLPEHFGDNLDALSDVLTGELEMPLHIEFANMTVDQLESFEDLLTTLEEIEEELEGFTFSYYLEQYESDDDDTEEEDNDDESDEQK